ncbi:MAG: WG repeat-containing protein [Flavobacterium sp.]|uniref:WG repeat-containing protein n=1 Tax=Flavobacterium sp. TaxID=239 RepID=UPI002B47858E|nr:WG repeat-containing protein [Flavobacterium sp.]WRH72189.1 MAG: WG repeat-containing protein [Flavobacterium sp.]
MAQEIAIPYRDGNLWGICNETGKILIEPKFDKLEFDGSSIYDKHDLLISYKNGLKGLLVNGKEILAPNYNFVYASDGFITTSSNENGNTDDVISFDGVSIFKKPIAYIISSGRIVGNYNLYHVMHHDLSESLLVFDNKSKKMIQTLYENYYSISKNGRQTYPENYTFMLKKAKNDDLSSETWDFSKFPFKKTTYNNSVDDEKYYVEQFVRKAKKNRSENYSGGSGNSYGTGYSSGSEEVVEEVGIREGRYDDVVISEPNNSNSERIKAKTISYNYTIKKDKIVLQKTINNVNEKPVVEEIQTNFNPKTSQLKSYYHSKKEDETTINYSNYLIYKNKNKSAIIFPESAQNVIYFDSITPIIREIQDASFKNKEIIFVVGNKNKNGILKFGLYSNVRNLVSKVIYDEIKQTILPSYNQISIFQTKINNKFGFIQADGKTIVMPKYDELKELNSTKYNYEKMIQTKVENQYGLLFSNNNSIIFIEAFSPYQIQDVIKSYPEQSSQILPEQKVMAKRIALLKLKDNAGKFVGYAATNGQLFFKN